MYHPDPEWLKVARSYIGLHETRGPQNNPRIVKWWKDIGAPFDDDETPWCGGFVGGCLAEAGITPVAGGAAARHWLNLPVKLDKPAYGAVVVFWRGSPDGWSGHVGFVVGEDERGNLMVLGGNQGNAVNIRPFTRDRVLGYRWPGFYPYEERFTLPVINSYGQQLSTNEA